MRKLFVGLLAATILLAATATAGAATAVPKGTVLMYGDSLTWEARNTIADQLQAKHWTPVVHSHTGTAPCDWLAWLPSDLATYHPTTVGILTAGNTGWVTTTCMFETAYSAAYYAKYQADLATFVATAKAAGAKVVFFAAPPVLDPGRDAAIKNLNAYGKSLAAQTGTSYSTGVRTAFATYDRYVQTKPCLATEAGLADCVSGQISIRTLPGYLDYGLHLCPVGIGPDGICSIYSSGAVRFGKAIATSLANPPLPAAP